MITQPAQAAAAPPTYIATVETEIHPIASLLYDLGILAGAAYALYLLLKKKKIRL